MRLKQYLPIINRRALAHISCWTNISADSYFILVDSSPFWIFELLLWIYRHFWTFVLITCSIVAGGTGFANLPSTIRNRIVLSCQTIYVRTIAFGLLVTRCLRKTATFVFLWLSRPSKDELANSKKILFEHKAIIKDIRLLKLHRRSLTVRITCELEDAFLSDDRQFEAISYTWGDPTPTHEILINGSPYMITANAHSALVSMTSILHSKYVWIDSICINQGSNKEKNHQILRMEEIYRRASCVVVWLGDADDSHLAFELLQELAYFTQSLTLTELITKYLPETSMPKWQALNKLVRSPWFDRVWVVQEIAVATSVKVHYGAEMMNWEELQRMLFTETVMCGPAQLCAFLIPHVDKGKIRDATEIHHARTMDILKHTILKNEKKSLFVCLELCMSFLATNPKDLVFALQAISEEGFSQFEPNYNKSVDEVFIEATHCVLASTQKSRISALSLAGTGFSRDMATLPSWVPQWGSGDRTTTLTNSGSRKAASIYDYQASGTTLPEISTNPHTTRLITVNGVQAGEIHALGSLPPVQFAAVNDPVSNKHHDGLLSSWLEDAATLVDNRRRDPYSLGGGAVTAVEAFWRTLLGDRLLSTEGTFRPAPSKYGTYFHASRKRHPYKMLIHEAANLSEDDIARYADQQGALFAAAMGPHTYKRTFCCTRSGYMGLVPPGSRVGDVVCVLFGMQTPVVLRKIEDVEGGFGEEITYELVGECYMHGMMDGEMLKEGLEKRRFTLR
ncbi:heterokaryon incompatibility protein-domain-containing protein [Halenospora varia]|nr:heterokaryon incompatibility protein-domain-containing protein [Halenospora varia]